MHTLFRGPDKLLEAMLSHNSPRTFAALLIALLVSGCGPADVGECGPSLSELRAREMDNESPARPSSVYYLVEIAQEVPGFGGVRMIHNPGGLDTLGIFLVRPDTAAAKRVRQALVDHHKQSSPSGPDPIRVEREMSRPIKILRATYDFAQLHSWAEEISRFVMPIPGANGAGMGANELRIGLDRESAEVVRCVEERLDELSIPRDAVTVEVVGPIRPLGSAAN